MLSSGRIDPFARDDSGCNPEAGLYGEGLEWSHCSKGVPPHRVLPDTDGIPCSANQAPGSCCFHLSKGETPEVSRLVVPEVP